MTLGMGAGVGCRGWVPRFCAGISMVVDYQNWDSNALRTIYEQARGGSIIAACELRIARPGGMQGYQSSHREYDRGAQMVT